MNSGHSNDLHPHTSGKIRARLTPQCCKHSQAESPHGAVSTLGLSEFVYRLQRRWFPPRFHSVSHDKIISVLVDDTQKICRLRSGVHHTQSSAEQYRSESIGLTS